MAKRRRRAQSTRMSGIAGAILLGLCCLWLGWLLLGQHNTTSGALVWPSLLGTNTTPSSDVQVPRLVAEGISLNQAGQTPTLSQQQAMTIASQFEPEAATNAKNTSAKYVLLNYVPTGTSTHTNLNNVPVWMVVYQRIPIEPNNAAVDPVPSTRSYHDLYVFVDANSGKEVLSVWL
ncbi:MAG: hypothetical protein NVS4B11_14510 [Ktedonobacteraceae bacterium]